MVRRKVFVDGSMTGEDYTFAAVPQPGDSVQIAPLSDPQILYVTSVMHVAKGTYETAPDAAVQLHVTSKRPSNV